MYSLINFVSVAYKSTSYVSLFRVLIYDNNIIDLTYLYIHIYIYDAPRGTLGYQIENRNFV